MNRKGADGGSRRVAGWVTAAGLGAVAALHALWATGSSWPRQDHDSLADLVVGQRPFPSRAATWTVAGMLAGASMTIARSAGATSAISLQHRRLVTVTSGALLLRGVAGLVVSAVGIGDSTSEFRRWDLRLYSPLCIALGLGAAAAASDHSFRDLLFCRSQGGRRMARLEPQGRPQT